MNKIKSIDVIAILPRNFKTFLTTSKIDYLSYILFEDSFTLDHFKRVNTNKKNP